MIVKPVLLVAVVLIAGCGSSEDRNAGGPHGEAPDCRPDNMTSCAWPDWVRSVYETKGYWPVTNYTDRSIFEVHVCFRDSAYQQPAQVRMVEPSSLASRATTIPLGGRIDCNGQTGLWWVIPRSVDGNRDSRDAWFTVWNPWEATLVNITGPGWGEHFVHDFHGDRVLIVVYEDGDVDTQLRVWNLKTRRVEHVLGPQHFLDDSSTAILTDKGLVNFRQLPGTQEYQLVLLAPNGKEKTLTSLERRPSQLREEDGTYYWVESDEDPPFRAQALMMLRDGQHEILYEKEALLKIEDTSGEYVVMEETTPGQGFEAGATCENTSMVHAASRRNVTIHGWCHYAYKVTSSSIGPKLAPFGTRVDGQWLFTRVDNQNYTGPWDDTNLFRHPNPLADRE
jgi:hypothetical protein